MIIYGGGIIPNISQPLQLISSLALNVVSILNLDDCANADYHCSWQQVEPLGCTTCQTIFSLLIPVTNTPNTLYMGGGILASFLADKAYRMQLHQGIWQLGFHNLSSASPQATWALVDFLGQNTPTPTLGVGTSPLGKPGMSTPYVLYGGIDLSHIGSQLIVYQPRLGSWSRPGFIKGPTELDEAGATFGWYEGKATIFVAGGNSGSGLYSQTW